MADEKSKQIAQQLAARLAQSKLVVPAEMRLPDSNEIDLSLLASEIIKKYATGKLHVVTAEELEQVINSSRSEKAPVPIEINRSADFKPVAREYAAEYKINSRRFGRTSGTAEDFVNYFKSRLSKLRSMIEKRESASGLVSRLDGIGAYMNGREVKVLGIVTSKTLTKNGHIILNIEDEYAQAKIMFMNWQGDKYKLLFDSAQAIISDEVVAVKGKMYNSFVVAEEVIIPDVPVIQTPSCEEDIAIAFLSDMHVGSKLFMEERFTYMIEWLNGGAGSQNKELAEKIKYIVVAGDVADGVGVYPNQEKELIIPDIYNQYNAFFRFVEAIPDYIHVFIAPGNHDAVRLAEPQPRLGDEIIKDFVKDNIHFVENPSYVTLHGVTVLAYHGASLDPVVAAIPGMSYSSPEKAMIEILKRRHLSPIYGGNEIVPTGEDTLVIDKVPNILHMGHVHKNGIANYHGVNIINSGTWQARTSYQVSLGHMPTPCIMPVYEMKKGAFTTINFGGGVK